MVLVESLGNLYSMTCKMKLQTWVHENPSEWDSYDEAQYAAFRAWYNKFFEMGDEPPEGEFTWLLRAFVAGCEWQERYDELNKS